MRTLLILAALLLAATGCQQTHGTKAPDDDSPLPACRFIYISGCKYVWCRAPASYTGGLDRVDDTCTPTDATVSSNPPTP